MSDFRIVNLANGDFEVRPVLPRALPRFIEGWANFTGVFGLSQIKREGASVLYDSAAPPELYQVFRNGRPIGLRRAYG